MYIVSHKRYKIRTLQTAHVFIIEAYGQAYLANLSQALRTWLGQILLSFMVHFFMFAYIFDEGRKPTCVEHLMQFHSRVTL